MVLICWPAELRSLVWLRSWYLLGRASSCFAGRWSAGQGTLFALTCRPSSGNPRGDRPGRCRDRPTTPPRSAPSCLTCCPAPSPWEGSRRRRLFLLSSSRSAARAPGAGRRWPVECRELLIATGAVGVVALVLGLLRVLSVFVSRGRWRAGRARNAGAVPAAPKRSAVVSCASARSASAWPYSAFASFCPRASGWRGAGQLAASRSGSCARPASGFARRGPRRSRGFRQETTARAASGCTRPKVGCLDPCRESSAHFSTVGRSRSLIVPLLAGAAILRDRDGLDTGTHSVLAEHSREVVYLVCD